MSKTETTSIVRRNIISGDKKELFLFIRAVVKEISKNQIEDRTDKKRLLYKVDWLIWLIEHCFLPEPEDCSENEEGYKMLSGIDPGNLLHDSTTLHDTFGYALSDLGNETVPSSDDPNVQVPISRNIFGRVLDPEDSEFVKNYNLMNKFPTKLMPNIMQLLADAMTANASGELSYPPMSTDFLSPARHFQKLYASYVKSIWDNKMEVRTEGYALMNMTFTSKREVIEASENVESALHALCILNKELPGSKDREFIDAIRQNQLGLATDKISDLEKSRITTLSTWVEGLWVKKAKPSAPDFLSKLRDCFLATESVGTVHKALVATTEPRAPAKQPKSNGPKKAGGGQAPDRKERVQELHSNENSNARRLNDLHSIVGQLVKSMARLEEKIVNDENSQPNKRPRWNQKAQGGGGQAQHFAGKASAKVKAKASFKRGNSSDEEELSDDEVVHQARKATVQGIGSRTQLRDFESCGDAENQWDDMPPLEYDTDDDPWHVSVNGGEPIAMSGPEYKVGEIMAAQDRDIERETEPWTRHPVLVNRALPDILEDKYGQDSFTLPMMSVDKTIWNALPSADQVQLRRVADLVFYPSPEYRGVKLVWDIKPDNYSIDRNLYYGIQTARSEQILDRQVRLMRMIWNSRQQGERGSSPQQDHRDGYATAVATMGCNRFAESGLL